MGPIVKVFDRRPYVLAVLIGATAIKIALASVLGWTGSVSEIHAQAQAFLAGKDLLDPRNTGGNPSFFLLGNYIIAAACLLFSEIAGIPFGFAIKLPAILSDFGIALLLYNMSRGEQWAAVIYMVNPITFLLSTYHGQLHTVALYAAVLALWLAERGRFILGGLVLGVAASARQHFAALVVPMAKRPEGLRAPALAGFVLSLILLNAPLLITSTYPGHVLTPNWNYGSWGYSMLLLQGPRVLSLVGFGGLETALAPLNRVLGMYGIGVFWIWAAAFAAWAWRYPGKDQWRAGLLFFLGVYLTSPGFGVQWLVWALPFYILVYPMGAAVYSGLGGAFLAGSYWQWGLNAKYGVGSLTANLNLLTWGDLAGVLLVGVLGLLTWVYCARAAWRLARA